MYDFNPIIGTINELFFSFAKDAIGAGYSGLIGGKCSLLAKGIRDKITKKIPDLLKSVLPNSNYMVKGSIGAGLLTRTPWVAILDKQITTSTQEDIYIVFLFSTDLKHVYLSLNQGTTVSGKFGTRLRKKQIVERREKVRLLLHADSEFLIERNDFDIADELYKEGIIYCIEWDCSSSQDKNKILNEYIRVYDRYKQLTSVDINQDDMNINLPTEYRSLLAAIHSKPFILLAGISGSGKSRIVRQLAYATGGEDADKEQKPYNYEMIQVRPNWHDSSELLGYVTRVSGKAEYIVTDFLRFLVKAWYFEHVPFFLCLDEMNLAPVEQYFAEYLSVLETRKLRNNVIVSDVLVPALDEFDEKENGFRVSENVLNDVFGKTWKINGTSVVIDKEREERLRKLFRKKGITLPPNLVVMGTVNMDETTFSFSRKVLDRAMTIEMNEVDFTKGLTKGSNRMPFIPSTAVLPTAVETADVYEKNKVLCDVVNKYLIAINDVLDGTPFKVGYRTRNEFMLYVLENMRYQDKDDCFKIIRALDEMTFMKILSRIEGDKNKLLTKSSESLLDVLKKQIKMSLEEIYNAYEGTKSIYEDFEMASVSLRKLDEMKRKLDNVYYCSFWC